MYRTASQVGVTFVVAGLALATASPAPAQQGQTPKDPWLILEGRYYAPGTTEIPLPEPPVTEESEAAIVLKGEWAAMGETYRQSLERLGEDDRNALLRLVADLEVAGMARQPERRLPRLQRVELNIARELANQDPEILVPIFQLHHDLYLAHREDRQWYLLHHSIAMVEELTSLYVKEAGSQGARVTAARMLASLAGHLQAGQQPASVDLYEQVLELDPTNESAYLGLAAHFEKRGGPFEPVVHYMNRLLEVYPGHREARLRLGLNQLRLGKEKAARELLEGLVAEPSSDWIYRLAAQELARHEAAAGRVRAAIKILEAAVRNAPGDQKLCIQLAFLYDKNRQSFDAHRVAEIAREGPPAVESPRGRYNSWPHTALDRDRRELRRLAASRVQLLARLLSDRRPQELDSAAESPEIRP